MIVTRFHRTGLRVSRYCPMRLAIRSLCIIALVCLFLVGNTQESFACSCSPPGSPTDELARSRSVFQGIVVKVYHTTVAFGLEVYPSAIYMFKVKAVWAGPLHETVYLDTVAPGSSCATGFALGTEYLIYGNGSSCSRTGPISEAKEDLAALGEGKAPNPGTSGPVPSVVARLEKILQASDKQPSSGASVSPMSAAAFETSTPTPTSTPVVASPAPTPEAALPMTPSPPARSTLTEEAAERSSQVTWPVAVLLTLVAIATLGLLVLIRARSSR